MKFGIGEREEGALNAAVTLIVFLKSDNNNIHK
jgi:hypothetical protein